MIGVDLETTGLDHNRDSIIGIGVGKNFFIDGQGYTLPPQATYHNGKFDQKFLRKRGYNTHPYTFDTMLAASLLLDRPASLSLDSLAKHYLGIDSWKSLDRKKMSQYSLEEVGSYCLKDVEITERLTTVLSDKLVRQGMDKLFHQKIMPAARMLLDVEYRGMRIDVEKTKALKKELESSLLIKQRNLYYLLGDINLNSPKQLLVALNKIGLQPKSYNYKKREVTISTSEEALQSLNSPIADELLAYRGVVKKIQFLTDWLEVQYEGRIYPTYNMANTRTGRLSCSEPNLQQVPRDKAIRSLFIPSMGKVFVIADYAQIEPRIAAHYSQDPALFKVFTSGQDLYGSIATNVLGVNCAPNQVKELYPEKRQLAKVIGLSILYGIGAKKLTNFIKLQAGLEVSESDAKQIIKDYFAAYPGLQNLRDRVERKINETGYVTNHYGRKIRIESDKIFSTGVNSLIQSSASDACLFSQLEFADNAQAKLVAIIHDEIIYETNPEYAPVLLKDLKDVMENQGFKCPIKLDAKVAHNWGDKG